MIKSSGHFTYFLNCIGDVYMWNNKYIENLSSLCKNYTIVHMPFNKPIKLYSVSDHFVAAVSNDNDIYVVCVDNFDFCYKYISYAQKCLALYKPTLICRKKMKNIINNLGRHECGNITDIEFVSPDVLYLINSDGGVYRLKLYFKMKHIFEKIDLVASKMFCINSHIYFIDNNNIVYMCSECGNKSCDTCSEYYMDTQPNIISDNSASNITKVYNASTNPKSIFSTINIDIKCIAGMNGKNIFLIDYDGNLYHSEQHIEINNMGEYCFRSFFVKYSPGILFENIFQTRNAVYAIENTESVNTRIIKFGYGNSSIKSEFNFRGDIVNNIENSNRYIYFTTNDKILYMCEYYHSFINGAPCELTYFDKNGIPTIRTHSNSKSARNK